MARSWKCRRWREKTADKEKGRQKEATHKATEVDSRYLQKEEEDHQIKLYLEDEIEPRDLQKEDEDHQIKLDLEDEIKIRRLNGHIQTYKSTRQICSCSPHKLTVSRNRTAIPPTNKLVRPGIQHKRGIHKLRDQQNRVLPTEGEKYFCLLNGEMYQKSQNYFSLTSQEIAEVRKLQIPATSALVYSYRTS